MSIVETDSGPAVVRPTGACLGAEIEGVNLAMPLSATRFAEILDAFHRHGVLCFRRQKLTPEQLVAFSARFGALDVHHMTEHTLPHLPQVRILSNVVKEGKAVGIAHGGMHWHSDLSYKKEPALATLLYGLECPPEGADTLFADMYAAYEGLPPELKAKLQGRRAVHDRGFRYAELYPVRAPLTSEQIAKVPPVEHPIIRIHPATRKPSLYMAKDVVSKIVGMPYGEGRALIDQLEDFATRSCFVYAHKWRPNDLIVWDNRCTLHRATPYDSKYRRTLQRTQVKGEVPIPA